MFTHLVIHYDEIALKSGNRNFFVKRLSRNLRELFGVNAKQSDGKIIVRVGRKFDVGEARKFDLIPGIANIAPAINCRPDLRQAMKAAKETVDYYKPLTFKIETTRADKKFPLTSPEINSQVGEYVLEAAGSDLRVDLREPELTVKIEFAKNDAFIIGRQIQGVGGLPVASAGKVICLLSGGIDSPVAAFLMMKRGASVDFIHFQNQTINKSGVEDKIRRLVARLAKIQGRSSLTLIPFADLQKKVISIVPAGARMVVYRRLMYKIAEQVGRKKNARAIVSGDSLSQVASQTLENLEVIYQATPMLKLAPCIGLNKREIMDIARKIGTYEISIEPYADCCSLLVARHPETKSRIENILKFEQGSELEPLIEKAIKEAKNEIIV